MASHYTLSSFPQTFVWQWWCSGFFSVHGPESAFKAPPPSELIGYDLEKVILLTLEYIYGF